MLRWLFAVVIAAFDFFLFLLLLLLLLLVFDDVVFSPFDTFSVFSFRKKNVAFSLNWYFSF